MPKRAKAHNMPDYQQYLYELLTTTAQHGASDLHLSPGHFPVARIDGRLVAFTNKRILDADTLTGIIGIMLGQRQQEFQARHDLTFAYESNQRIRFRVHAYQTEGYWAATLRYVPDHIRSVEELNLPPVIKVFTKLAHGLVFVVSPSGQGRTTTLAALVDLINHERAEKIITVEQPIEYVLQSDKSVVDQRQVGIDTGSVVDAITAAGDQDINVLMVSAIATSAEANALMYAAETGHLVLAGMTATGASHAIERIIDFFPLDLQQTARNRLAATISGIVAQRLTPRIKGGLIPAIEVMIATTAIRTHIRDNKPRQLDATIETSQDMGMIPLDRSLADLVRRNEISIERAEFYSRDPSRMRG